MKVFVACPYSTDDLEQKIINICKASRTGRDLLAAGHTPFVPTKMTSMWDYDERLSYEDFVRIGLEWLRHCDVVLVLGDSPGTRVEILEARRLGIPVCYAIEDIISG